jgi:hypothetical protein
VWESIPSSLTLNPCGSRRFLPYENNTPASGYRAIGSSVEPTLYNRITQDQCDQLIANGQSCDGNDGLKKFDLTKLNQVYFDRLRGVLSRRETKEST